MESPDIGTQTNTGYIWLAYSVFFLIEPVLSHRRRLWIECALIYAIFLIAYISYMKARTIRQRHLLLVAFYILGLVSLPITTGASSFFVYSAAFLPFVVASVPIIVTILVVQALGLLAEGLLLHVNFIPLLLTSFLMLVVGASNTFIARQKRADAKLRMANEQLAAVAERERIARDLHDVLGHTLSVIVLKAELAGRLIERDPQRAAREIADVERTARTALSEVREAIGGYRSQGLPAEMELARTTLQAAGVTLACETPLPHLHAAEETVLCLAVREAVTNIVRHAQATHCRICFNTSADGYHSLFITDDGAHSKLHEVHEGNGLRGMRERVQSLGGRLSITNDPGVTLLIELPQTASRQSKAPCVVA